MSLIIPTARDESCDMTQDLLQLCTTRLLTKSKERVLNFLNSASFLKFKIVFRKEHFFNFNSSNFFENFSSFIFVVEK